MPVGITELALVALTIVLVFLAAKLMWWVAGAAARGPWWKTLIGFLLFWVLTTIIGAIAFLALVSIRRKRFARDAAA